MGIKSFFQSLFKPRDHGAQSLFSPNGRLELFFNLDNGKPFYSVKKDGKDMVKKSFLGFDFTNLAPIKSGLKVIRTHRKSFDETWTMLVGEQEKVRNNYNELAIYLSESEGLRRIMTLRFRVFDDGFAFRYEFPMQDAGVDEKKHSCEWIISDELTEFNIDINSETWSIPAYQPDRYEYLYEKKPIFELEKFRHTPFTIKTPTGHYLAIHEAALYDYGSMTLGLNENKKLQSDITPLSDGSRAHIKLPFNTPWRTVLVAHSATELLKSRMMYNLNDKPHKDFNWVKPIKFLGIWWAMFVGEFSWATGDRHGATTEHALEYIDYCVRLGISGLLIEGWNKGWDGTWIDNGDLFDFTTPTDDFDIKKITDYARSQNVEIIGHHETAGAVKNYEKQLPKALDYYKEFGIDYIKLGYVGSRMNARSYHDTHGEFHHSQFGVRHYQKIVELAAERKICLDIHEPIKGTGIERTFPNLLTREGARGQEYEGGGITPEHFVTLPFTRGLAGGFDMTPGLFDLTNFMRLTTSTLARQLAFYVCIWHGGLPMIADRPEQYLEYQDGFQVIKPAFKFLQDVPVNFSRTIPLLGEIGEFFVTARQDRDSKNWFIGGLTDQQPRKFSLFLDFLDSDTEYEATVYGDEEFAHYRDNPYGFKISSQKVKKGDYLPIFMASGGGVAISLKV
ncbi:MAG: glycoside hydrolase family 97 protein [Candidatus Nomurabacteria bacterium]|jgi:alpha-glucosidase|nr:glycoside hydrolase family 97 protein [Candidatus Nomurabacteria bacterium]